MKIISEMLIKLTCFHLNQSNSRIITILKSDWFKNNYEVGARSYKYTGKSNAAWVRVTKWFAGLRPAVEGYGRFHCPMSPG